MPIHLNDVDLASRTEGLNSALIIPCYLCPAVTLAVRNNKPFLQPLRHFFKSPPFEQYIDDIQFRLGERGVRSAVFKSHFVLHWFLCMWTFGRRKKLKRQLAKYDAATILGCDSATEAVLDLVDEADCKVIQGMEVDGFMNAEMTFHRPCDISFADCRIIPIEQQTQAG